jgi:hypothetical protein
VCGVLCLADDDKKKKKKKKKGEEDEKGKDKGKGPGKKTIAAMQEALKKMREEEERLAQEEAERIRKEEEAERAREEQVLQHEYIIICVHCKYIKQFVVLVISQISSFSFQQLDFNF